MCRTDFVSDLKDGIERYFDEHGIRYTRSDTASPVAVVERYFYSIAKMIDTRPRRVHCSAELETTLETLARHYVTPIQAIKARFELGHDLSEFLSKGASDAKINDGLLSDFGVHHFHLGTKPTQSSRHVERTDYLLFVHVRPCDAYFLDVRKHPNRRDSTDFGWSDVDILNIIDSNWPEVLKPYILPGVKGSTLTDEQRKELRSKNVNVVTQIGDKTIAPPGGGLLANGANLACTFQAMKLIFQLEQIEQVIKEHWDDCKRGLQHAGIDANAARLQLVRVSDTNLPKIRLESLAGDLGWSGWVISDATSGTLIDWSFEIEPTAPPCHTKPANKSQVHPTGAV